MDGQGDPTVYLHGDMVRSTMLMTDETGSAGVPPASLAYTAFGEPVTYDAGSQTWRVGFPAAGGMGGSPVTRYQYASGFGYESGLITLQGVNPALPPVTLQHVGERWYDPALGRFGQRDPIGIAGGMNVYAYCANEPLAAADPLGLWSIANPWGVKDEVKTGPWWARFVLNLTGGRDNSVLDDEATVNRIVLTAGMVPFGMIAICVIGPPAAVGAIGWGIFRGFGCSSGSWATDAIGDGLAIGAGLTGTPGIKGPRVPGGKLGGFPGKPNPPHLY